MHLPWGPCYKRPSSLLLTHVTSYKDITLSSITKYQGLCGIHMRSSPLTKLTKASLPHTNPQILISDAQPKITGPNYSL